MKSKKSLLVVLALLTLMVFVLAACGGGGEEQATEQGAALKLGILLPATGDLGDLGVPMINSAKLAVERVNEAGGILGQQVEIDLKDTETDEVAGRDAMDQMVNVDGVPAVVGAAGSGITFACLEVAKPGNVVMVSPSATSPDFTTYDDGGFFFRTAPSDALQGKVMAQLAKESGYTKAATLALNNAYGEAFKNVFIDTFKAGGGEVVADILYDPQGTTFDSEITKLVDADPDCVILVGYPETGSAILRAAYQQGLLDSAEFFLSEGMVSVDLAAKVGKDDSGNYIIEGIRGTRPKAEGPAYDDFAAAYEAAYGEPSTGPFDANSYDAAMLIMLAAEQAGATDGPSIRDALQSVASPPGEKVSDFTQALEMIKAGTEIDYEGACGNLNFDDVGDVLSNYEVWQIQTDGGINTVEEITPEG